MGGVHTLKGALIVRDLVTFEPHVYAVLEGRIEEADVDIWAEALLERSNLWVWRGWREIGRISGLSSQGHIIAWQSNVYRPAMWRYTRVRGGSSVVCKRISYACPFTSSTLTSLQTAMNSRPPKWPQVGICMWRFKVLDESPTGAKRQALIARVALNLTLTSDVTAALHWALYPQLT